MRARGLISSGPDAWVNRLGRITALHFPSPPPFRLLLLTKGRSLKREMDDKKPRVASSMPRVFEKRTEVEGLSATRMGVDQSFARS